MKHYEQNEYVLRNTIRRISALLAGMTWAVVLAATLLVGHAARGAVNQYFWQVGTDVYNNPNAWTPTGVPTTTNDFADVSNDGIVNFNTGMTYAMGTLTIGGAFGGGTFMMNGGELDITNLTSGTLFSPGNAGNGSFIMNGGTLNIARPSNGNAYYQDGASPGNITGATGTITLNNGRMNILLGMEIGKNGGTGIINVNGGIMMANGWFTPGFGNTPSMGILNLTGGTLYILRNFGNNRGATGDAGLRIMLGTGTGIANISGGALYTQRISIGNQNNGGTGILNVSGGDLYIGNSGIVCGQNNATQVKAINLSGGNFRTVNMDQNTTGQGGLSTILTGGTNWTWSSANLPAVNLTNNPGAGITTFIPDAGKTITLQAQFTGVGGLNFNGPGTNLLQAANTYTGGTTLSQGTLAFGSGGSIPDSTLTIPSGAAVVFASGNAVQNYANNFTGPGDVYVTGNAYIYGSLGHSGKTIVSSGTLAVGTGTLNSTPLVTVTNTGTLAGIGPIGAPVTVASTTLQGAHLRMGMSPLNIPATLTINNNVTLGVGSELDIKLGTATTTGSGVNDLLVVNGNLTIDPNAYLSILPLQQLTAGTYVIATYTGTLTGTFTNSFPGFRYGLTLDYSTTGQIKLNVTGSSANLVWTGVTNNVAATNWDLTTTANWTNTATLLADTFAQGDAVTFDDTTRNTNVVLAAALYPSSITFNGNTNWSVTGTGSGRISGDTGITKNGNGTVLLAAGLGGGNDYLGPVNINGGILKMNGALSLGATNGSTTVASGATLDLNGQNPNDEPMVLSGAGYGGTNGAINNSSGTSPSQSGGPRRVTLAGDTTLNASGSRWDMGINTLGAGGGSFAGNGHTLTKIGAQQIWLHELGDTGLGDILVNAGTLGFQFTIGLGDPSKTITVMPGATFGIWQAPTQSKQVVLTNGATLYSDGASNALSGTITLFGTNTIQASTAFDILSPIVGTGGFHKTAASPLYLPSANTYSGPTFIDAGSVVLGPSGSIANSPLITLASGTTLDVSQTGGLSLGNGQMIAGSGSVLGNVSAGTGSQLAPGTATAAGTLAFANNLTLNGATNVIKLSGNPATVGGGVNDLVSVTNTLTLTGVSTIQINPLGILNTAAPYTVMKYGVGTPSAANLRVVSSSSRYTISLVDPATTPGTIQVNITGNPGLLVWKGGVAAKPNTWDNTTTNWLNIGTGLRDDYISGDNVIFNDTASTNTINLTTAALGLISLSNNATAYTLTGNGLITAAVDMEGTGSFRLAVSNAPAVSGITANYGTLIFDVQNTAAYTNYGTISDNGGGLSTIMKAGSNTMVLSAPDNSLFSGTIIISNGILQYTNALALGAASSPLYATNNGSLDIQNIPSGLKNIIIEGNGFNGQGAVMSSTAAGIANDGIHTLTLAGDASIGASNRFDIFGGTGGTVNGNGFKLTEVGPGSHLFNAIGATALGDIHIVRGRLGFQGTVDMGDPNKTLTIESNAVLTMFDVSPAVSKNLVMNGNATFDSGGNGAGNTFNGPVSLVGTNNRFGLRKHLHLEAGVSGTGSLAAGDSPVGAGTGSLYLDAANTYSGSTTISNGHAIVVGAGSSLGVSSLIQINNGATLDVSAPASFSFGAGQTLIGSGTVVGGTVVFGSGSTLAPGFPDNNTYNLTMNGTLTLQSGSTNRVVVNKTGSVANDAVTGLTSVSLGGTLVINSVGNPLADGDAIQPFFASSAPTGSYDKIIPATPGTRLAWDLSTLNSDGKVRVISSGPPATPTNMLFSVSANQLTLSWPSNYTGWTLQGQTNNPGVGITTNWHDVPGSTATNEFIMPMGQANGSVFFRMILK